MSSQLAKSILGNTPAAKTEGAKPMPLHQPLHQADHNHTIATDRALKELDRVKTEIYRLQNTPGVNAERVKQAWAHYHVLNDFYNATIDLVNAYNNELSRAAYTIAAQNEVNRALKLRLDTANARPSKTASVYRDIFYHGTEKARQNHFARINDTDL